MSPQQDRVINMRVLNVADGTKHLVFTVAGSDECVGEIRVAVPPQYLKVVGQLFTRWIDLHCGGLPSSIRNILHGGSPAVNRR